MDSIDISFVFPCLDESETLAECIREVRTVLEQTEAQWEIIVADNGSTDDSRDIAQREGARVVPVETRGYGAALRGGIQAACGTYVAFADADGSYMLEHVGTLYRKALETDADMVIASRLSGRVEPDAMPFLHRHLGTPVLTRLINLLYRGSFSDCNSGFRLLRRESFLSWNVRATGMEFASELLIKSLKSHAKIAEVPSGLRPDRRSRTPHLRTWRDGMRHLLFILSERPEMFEWAGLLLVVLASAMQLLAYGKGLTAIAGVQIFDYHTQAMLIPVACAGLQSYVFSWFLYLTGTDRPLPVTRRLISLDEAHVFLLLILWALAECAGFGFVLWRWSRSGFADLDMIRFILFMTHFLCLTGFAGAGLLGVHVFKKRDRPA
ncbi:MAG: glycosyltransferase family 2 protein [Lentisphaeria bacterium]|nr:glycosyltransferase family 2 protein [Lentisphaeria bacterium]